MLATVLDYGITADAGVQHRWGRRLLRWYASFGAEPRVTDNLDITKYGGFCEILTELFVLASPLDVYESRHVANLGFAFLAFLAVLSIGRRLAGARGAFLALLFLALTPRFYGHAFNNAKDAPFAAMFALAVASILAVDGWPRVSWRRVLLAGVAIGLASAVRVGAIVLFGFALALWLGTLLARARASGRPLASAGRDAVRLFLAWAAALAAGWTAMVAFWPWAMLDPLRNPFRAADRFARYWEDMILFYDGRLQPASQVSRFYLPNWLALTLPETYLVAAALGLVALVLLWRSRPSGRETLARLLPAAWLASIPALLVTGVVVERMPLYDGLRHFLFLLPLLAVLAGASVAAFLRSAAPRGVKAVGLTTLGISLLITLVDMVRLHPYEAVYFNRLVAGGMKQGVARYEGDYWCLSYKEGCEWLLRRYAGARCQERIRVAGYSVLQQPQYYLEKTEEGRRLFTAVPEQGGDPHYVLATTRFQDHLRAPGTLVFNVEREGAKLFYLFEVRPPRCEWPGERPGGHPTGPP
jgi:Dolichyl-phosphate-mannose-protein mannosyltransferase